MDHRVAVRTRRKVDFARRKVSLCFKPASPHEGAGHLCLTSMDVGCEITVKTVCASGGLADHFDMPHVLQLGISRMARSSIAALLIMGLALPSPAFAREPAPLPDSALTALSGRQVTVSTTAGLAVEGELVAFDEGTVTVLRADGQIVVVPRTEVASISVVTTPVAPQPAEGAVTNPADPNPTVAPAQTGPAANTEVVLSELEKAELAGTLYRGGMPNECLADQTTPLCRSMLKQGADGLDRAGVKTTVTGGVMLGLGLTVLMPLGVWFMYTADKLKDAEKACEALGTSCGSKSTGRYVGGGVSLLFFAVFGIGGAVLLGAGGKQRRVADKIRVEHQLTFAPTIQRGYAGLSFGGRF